MPKLFEGPRVWLVVSDDAGNVMLLGETADPDVIAAVADKTRFAPSKWDWDRDQERSKPMTILLPSKT